MDMTTVMKHSDLLKRAVEHIDACREECVPEHPADLHKLVEDAAMRFNLGPQDTEYLLKLFAHKFQDAPAP